jgi:GNAT superfamily N-acetyltransferase
MSLRFATAAERPDLLERNGGLRAAWPEFMLQDPVSSPIWHLLYDRAGEFQFFLIDESTGELAAEGNSIPVHVDLDDLPDRGWEEAIERGIAATEAPTSVSALQVLVDRRRHGQGLSRLMLQEMTRIAAAHGFADLVAPVRPSLKHRYPLVPMDRYVAWTRADGYPFDPWLRVHARLGATIERVCPLSMQIPGTVAEWEQWAGMAFPESGSYVVPGALVPVEVDREADRVVYVEPNVWMRHRL